MVRINAKIPSIVAALLLAIIVTVAFSPQLANEFIAVDDPLVITRNSHVVTGLNWPNITWAFKSTYAYNWHPLTWISHMTDVQLFDLKPSGHHFTSLLIHVANVVLLFLLLRSLTGLVWASFFISALFGVHPLRVESVAWAAERKDVLSVFFWVLTLVAYVKYVRRPGTGRYIAVLAAFGLALMSKPMVVTLPFVLFVLDYWPLGRMARDQRGVAQKKLVIEKIPLVAMALAAGTVTMFAQHSGGVVKTLHSYPLWIRVSNAILSYVSYLWKMILPVDLYFPYPHPGSAVSLVKVGLSSILLLAVTGLVLFRRKQSPFLLTGWLWYLVTLAPVIGLIQVAEQAMADRYTYIPSVGIVLAVVLSIVHGRSILRMPAAILGSIAIVALSGLTRRQITYWHDDATFFGRVVTLNPWDNVAKNNLGQALAKEGRDVQAIALFQQVLKAKPFSIEPRFNMAMSLIRLGRDDEAVEQLKVVLGLAPRDVDARIALGNVLTQQGRTGEALGWYSEALRLKPDNTEALMRMGDTMQKMGRITEAVRFYQAVLGVWPNNPEAESKIRKLKVNPVGDGGVRP